jgi:hypothetical protein
VRDWARYWRVGRKLGRTVYVQVGEEPSDDDVLIGMFDHPALAEMAVSDHNSAVAAWTTQHIPIEGE